MVAYLVSRVLQALLVVLGVLTLVFVITRLTGDPALLLLPLDATPEQREAFRHATGLDASIAVQYLRYLWSALHGDLGVSIKHGQSALESVMEAVPATATLALTSLAFALLVA